MADTFNADDFDAMLDERIQADLDEHGEVRPWVFLHTEDVPMDIVDRLGPQVIWKSHEPTDPDSPKSAMLCFLVDFSSQQGKEDSMAFVAKLASLVNANAYAAVSEAWALDAKTAPKGEMERLAKGNGRISESPYRIEIILKLMEMPGRLLQSQAEKKYPYGAHGRPERGEWTVLDTTPTEVGGLMANILPSNRIVAEYGENKRKVAAKNRAQEYVNTTTRKMREVFETLPEEEQHAMMATLMDINRKVTLATTEEEADAAREELAAHMEAMIGEKLMRPSDFEE